jgi:hypothetical protein
MQCSSTAGGHQPQWRSCRDRSIRPTRATHQRRRHGSDGVGPQAGLHQGESLLADGLACRDSLTAARRASLPAASMFSPDLFQTFKAAGLRTGFGDVQLRIGALKRWLCLQAAEFVPGSRSASGRVEEALPLLFRLPPLSQVALTISPSLSCASLRVQSTLWPKKGETKLNIPCEEGFSAGTSEEAFDKERKRHSRTAECAKRLRHVLRQEQVSPEARIVT